MSVTFYSYDAASAEERVWSECELNVSNRNASLLLDHLGFKPDPEFGLCGRIAARELKEKCVLHSAVGGVFDDDGFKSARTGNMIDCALPAGYFADRVRVLERLADECLARGWEWVHFA